MRLLITSSRMPFALDAIRKLGTLDHEVFACDSYEAAPGSHSKNLASHFTTASASDDPAAFAADVERIAKENEIELILPMFEEVFYLAAQHARLSAVTSLYAPPFVTLARVHDKGTFQELCEQLEIRTPQTVLAHSKGLFEAMSDGITWDGQPIPGLPAEDAEFLAKLTGD
jgi:predicted ATP-grasp superfamily ATP-dependent carboligase